MYSYIHDKIGTEVKYFTRQCALQGMCALRAMLTLSELGRHGLTRVTGIKIRFSKYIERRVL